VTLVEPSITDIAVYLAWPHLGLIRQKPTTGLSLIFDNTEFKFCMQILLWFITKYLVISIACTLILAKFTGIICLSTLHGANQ